MNRTFIILGLLCAGLGVLLWATTPLERPSSQDERMSLADAPSFTASDAGEKRAQFFNDDEGAGHASTAPGALSGLSIATGFLADRLPLHEHPGYQTACGALPALMAQIRAADQISELALPGLPMRGRAEVLIRSTVGGLDQQARLAAEWSIAADASIHLRTDDTPVIARVQAGRWVLAPKTASPVLLDIARLVAALHDSWATPQNMQRDQVFHLFGQEWTVTGLAPAVLLGESNDRLHPEGPRDALLIALAADGSIAALERFQSDPSTVSEPGFMVRRVRLIDLAHLDDSRAP